MKIFYVNTQANDTAAAMVQSFTNAQPADVQIFSQGNTAEPFQVHLLAPNPDTTTQNTVPFIYVDPSATTIHISAGKLNQPVFSGTFTLTDPTPGSQTTAAIAYNISAANLQIIINRDLNNQWGNALVSGPDGGPWTVDRGITGALANALVGNPSAISPPNSVLEVVHLQGGSTDLDEVFLLQLLQPPAVFAVASGNGLPAALVTITIVAAGGSGVNGVQTVVWNADSYSGGVWLTATLPTGNGINTASLASPSVVTTFGNHNLRVGDSVVISGNTQSALNGTHTVASVPSVSTFTTEVNLGTAGTGGTVSLTRQIPQVQFNCSNTDLLNALGAHGSSQASTSAFSVVKTAQGAFQVTFQGTLGGYAIAQMTSVNTLAVPAAVTGTLNINSAGVEQILSGADDDVGIKLQIREVISLVPTTIAWRNDAILRPNLEPTGTVGSTEIPPIMQYMAIALSNGIDHLAVTFPAPFSTAPSYVSVDIAIGSGGSFIRGEADLTTLTSSGVTIRFNPSTDTSTYIAMLDARI